MISRTLLLPARPCAPGAADSGRRAAVGRLAALTGVALALNGCAFLFKKPPVEGKPVPERFELEGKIAVRYGDDGYSGTFRWQHAGERDRVELFTPIGTLHARLLREPAGAILETADGKRAEEPDAQTLSLRILGWELPLTELPFWLFTRPAPGAGAADVESGPEGRPVRLSQGQWRVTYRSYFASKAPLLPERLDLEKPGLKVKLIASHWGEPELNP
ncbi:MAG: outer membrane lipoprotein LolB [Betaproteobacteria bacterium]|nr:outer membrane lipoprotein LolB [Betaproteobacteria bacterium]